MLHRGGWLKAVLRGEPETYRRPAWSPSVDVYRTRGGWLVKFNLAGIRPEDIRLSVSGRYLTIRGQRRDWSAQEHEGAYSMEISYNRFERSIELPCSLEGVQPRTEYRDGMLLVRLPAESPS